MDYKETENLLQGRCKNSRKIANNTYLHRRKDGNAVQLHDTDILLFLPSGKVVVNTGGWQTVTTKSRLNDYLPNGFRLFQEKGTWFWNDGNRTPFTDGDAIGPKGALKSQAKPDQFKAQQKLIRRINKYAKQCSEALPLEEPSGADCWYCAFHFGENDTSHLESHIDEGYIVPSLVYKALKDAGYGDLIISAAFGKVSDHWTELSRDYVKRAVRKMMKKSFGLPA